MYINISSSHELVTSKYLQLAQTSAPRNHPPSPRPIGLLITTYKFCGSTFLTFSVSLGGDSGMHLFVSWAPGDYPEGLRQLTSWEGELGLCQGVRGGVAIMETTNSVCHRRGTHHTTYVYNRGGASRANVKHRFCLMFCIVTRIFIYYWRNKYL